ncbi:family with sequence similarity 183 member A [Turdus rufiventris]|nr:family with sequence similarity 183 member A [Turdus rufiventris]
MDVQRGERDPPDALQNRIHAERAKRERRWRLLFTKYTVNPYHPSEASRHRELASVVHMLYLAVIKVIHLSHFFPVHMIARKPMAWHENIHEPVDDEFLKFLHRAADVPRRKYPMPQTESQEIGWHTTPLVPFDHSDTRFYFPRWTTEITIHGYPAPRGENSKE